MNKAWMCKCEKPETCISLTGIFYGCKKSANGPRAAVISGILLEDAEIASILEWYCREGTKGNVPDCDAHCPGKRGENPCFQYRELREKLEGRKT